MSAHSLASLRASANSLAPHYAQSKVSTRLLLSGHSHQAWPDVAAQGQAEAFADACALLGDKWDRAFAKAERVREGFRTLLDDSGDTSGHIALMSSTHDAVIRFLSALPLRQRSRIITTDGEFHTLRRQLDRLREEGITITRVRAAPSDTLYERLASALYDDGSKPAAVMLSSVSFLSGEIVPHLGALQEECDKVGALLFIDTYHHLNVAPFSIVRERLAHAYVTGGGYKYCQLGEGNCFLRLPKDSALRPVITGWYSEFELVAGAPGARVDYPDGPGRFAGATYDPTSHYRAAAVFDFFAAQGLTVTALREVSQHQMARLRDGFDALHLPRGVLSRADTELTTLGGFLALQGPYATAFASQLRARGVDCDARGYVLRLGPAPYLSDAQLDAAMAFVGEVARGS